MMEEQKLKKRVRRRQVNFTNNSAKLEKNLTLAMDDALSVKLKIEALQAELTAKEVVVSDYMQQLDLTKYSTDRANAVYDHPSQRKTSTYDAAGLFGEVTPEDFVASVKIQKTLANKVIDPKILSKYETVTKSELKPKTLKLTSKS